MALVAKTWGTDDDDARSQNGSWLSDEECSDIGSNSTSKRENLPCEDPDDPPEWSHSQIKGLYSQRTRQQRARVISDWTESEFSVDLFSLAS